MSEGKAEIFYSTSKKKYSRTSPDVQFEKFSLPKQQNRPRTDYERNGKTISKISDKKKLKQNQCQNAACEQKTPARKENLGKNGLAGTMNGSEKPFRKKSDTKMEKNSKNQSEIAE